MNEPKPRGMATLSPERRSEIGRLGGLAVKPENRAFSKSRELAAAAGRKGGGNVPHEKRTFSRYPELVRRLADERSERARNRKAQAVDSNHVDSPVQTSKLCG